MLLRDGLIGSTYIVERIELNEKVARRLHTLGMTDGTKIAVMNKKKHGAMVVKIRGTRFALGGDFLSGIYVREAH